MVADMVYFLKPAIDSQCAMYFRQIVGDCVNKYGEYK